MLTWTPDPAPPLISVSEESTNIVATLSVTSDDPLATVTSLTHSPLAPNMSAVVAASSMVLTVHDFVGAFPIKISYLLDTVQYDAATWPDVPAAAQEIVQFDPPQFRTLVYDIEVTAWSGSRELETVVYTVVAVANYTLGATALAAAVDARRDLPHVW